MVSKKLALALTPPLAPNAASVLGAQPCDPGSNARTAREQGKQVHLHADRQQVSLPRGQLWEGSTMVTAKGSPQEGHPAGGPGDRRRCVGAGTAGTAWWPHTLPQQTPLPTCKQARVDKDESRGRRGRFIGSTASSPGAGQ